MTLDPAPAAFVALAADPLAVSSDGVPADTKLRRYVRSASLVVNPTHGVYLRSQATF